MNILNRGYWVTTLLSVVGLAITTTVMMQTGRQDRHQTACRPGSTSSSPASSASPRASPSSTSPSTTRPARSARSARSPRRPRRVRRRTSSRGTAVGFETTAVTAITIGIALFASHWLGEQAGIVNADGRQRRRHLRDRRRDDGHADDDGLHPGHGHVRPDHRQRRRDRRVQPGRGRRARDHRPPRRRRQHDQGADQGLRDRVRLAGRVPAVQRLHRQGQPDPGAGPGGHRPSSWTSVNLANVNVFIAALIAAMLVYLFSSLAIRAVGTTAQAIIVEVRRQFREMPGIMDYTQRPDYARVVDITTSAALREMIAARRSSPSPPRSSSASSSATRRSPACSWSARSPASCWPPSSTTAAAPGTTPRSTSRPATSRTTTGNVLGKKTDGPRRRGRRRHGRRPVQGHRRPVAPRAGQAHRDDQPWSSPRCSSASRSPPSARATRAAPKEPRCRYVVQALVMGIVQGLTEFLPISSSGHLILVPVPVRLGPTRSSTRWRSA